MKKLIDLVKLSAEADTDFLLDLTPKGKGSTAKSKTVQLVTGILKGSILDDSTACKVLYDNATMKSSTTYNSLKMRLFTRLKNQFLIANENRIFKTRLKRAEFSIIRNAAASRMLAMKASDSTALYLAKKGYELSVTCQCTFEAAIFAETIAADEAFKGHQKEFERYSQKAIFWREQNLAERKSRSYFERVMSWYAARWTIQIEHVPIIESYLHEIEDWQRMYNSHSISIDWFRLSRVKAEIIQDYATIIRLVDEVEKYYSGNSLFRSRHILGAFYTSSLAANIWLGKYSDALECAAKCQELLPSGTQNWYTFQEYYLILSLRMREYDQSLRIFNGILDQVRSNSAPELVIQKWSLFEFYLRFVCLTQPVGSLLPLTIFSSESPKSRYRQFRKSLTLLTRGEGGYAIISVFAQILFLLSTAQFSALVERDESLQTYRRKRITPLNYRLTQFARMIHLMVQSDFDYAKTQSRCAGLLETLRNVPQKYHSVSAETLEFVPLEDLWEVMMTELKRVQVFL